MHLHTLGHGQRIAQLIKRDVWVLRNKLFYKRLMGRELTAPSVIQSRLKSSAAPRQHDR